MDAKDLRTQPALSDRNNEGSKYAQSGGGALQCDRNKTYQDIGSNSLAKGEVQNARPCAVIGPDRIVPPPVSSESYMKKASAESWSCTDNTYRRPPEYPRKLANYSNPTRNISPRQTFQENMQRIMVPATYNTVKINDDSNYAQIPDRNIPLSKNIKLNVPSEAKYCDVPYAINPNSNEQKSVRNSEMCVPSVNPPLSRTAPHGWPPSAVNLRPARSYGAPELYQYQEYASCGGPRPIVPRSHRTHPEDPGYIYADSYYPDGNIRYKPYPTVKDRYPPARYDYIGNYTNPFHPPPSYTPHKYDLQKSIPPHPFPPYAPVKYLENRVSEPILDGYQRNQQGNYTMPYPNQVIHPNYGTVIGNCSQNKMHPFVSDSSTKNIATNKLPYDNNNKSYVEYESSRPKMYAPSDSYFVSEMGRLHSMKTQGLMPNYPNLNMHAGPPNPYYKKDNAQMKNLEYMAHYRNLDPAMNIHNPMMRHVPMFSPNTLAISPTDSSVSNDTNQTLGMLQEDCGYVSQSSTASVRSMDSTINRLPNDYYRRYYDSRFGHLVRSAPMMAKNESLPHSNTSKDKKNIDVRQFLQMWNEGDEETDDTNSKENITKMGPKTDNKLTKKHEGSNNHEQLYVLGLVNVPSEELSKYEHIQTVSKLPENIKGYNNIELLNQFEEAIESSNLSNLKSQPDNFQMQMKGGPPKQMMGILPRPVSPLDVESKISQSIIHKEVGCNFEIKPCSPKMLNVEVAAPVQNILAERAIEKVANPVSKSPMLNTIEENIDCNLMKRPDHMLNIMNDNLRIASCKMINTQYSTINPIDSIKSTYSFQDLESSSGLCLASLPRLDNDIELNFPEVNQQFINANRGDAAVSTSTIKDLPTLDMLDQSVTDVKHKNINTPVELDSKIRLGSSNTEPEREFSKLSKYRKNKTNISESYEKKSRDSKEETIQNNQNAIRTDSVIIKNPENVKKYDENSDFFVNRLNEPQQTPMNLTSHMNYDFNGENKLENDLGTDCDKKDNQPIDIAIDFSVNKTNLNSHFKSTDTEINTEEDNKIQKVVEKIHSHKTLDNDLPENVTFNTKHDDLKPTEDDGHTSDNCNPNKGDNFRSHTQDNVAKITNDLKQETNHDLNDAFDPSPNESESDSKHTNKNTEPISDDCTNLERILISDNYEEKPLPFLNDSSRECFMNDNCNNSVPKSPLSKETESLIKMDLETSSLLDESQAQIEKELEMICSDNNSQSELEGTIIKQIQEGIESNSTDLNVDENNSVLVITPQNEDYCQTNLSLDEPNNNTNQTSPVVLENSSTPYIENSSLTEDLVNNEVNIIPSNEVINAYNDCTVSNPPVDLESNEMKCYDSKEHGDSHEVCVNKSFTLNEEIQSKEIKQFPHLWSKKTFSPLIQNLLTFREGNVYTQKNFDVITEMITEKSYEHVDDVHSIVQPIEDLKSVNDMDIIGILKRRNSNSDNSTNLCELVDEVESKTEAHIKNDENINTSSIQHIISDDIMSDDPKHDITDTQSNNIIPSTESSLEDVKDDSKISETDNSVCDVLNETSATDEMNVDEASIANENESMITENPRISETNNAREKIENKIQKLGLGESDLTGETCIPFHDDASGEIGILSESDIMKKSIIVEDERKSSNKLRCNNIETLFKRRRHLKRSLSDSALHVYNFDEKPENVDDDLPLVLPLKRKKINRLESVDLCSIINQHRRNSISAIYNEDNVSFCILIDDSCIITEEEETEEQKLCFTEFSEECLDLQNESINVVSEEHLEEVVPSPQVRLPSDYSDSCTLECEEDKVLDNSWVEDVACVETVISDDISETIVYSEPQSPKNDYLSDNDESGVFSSSEHTDKVKCIYGDMMCNDDAQYLETLYKTPQMNVDKALNIREPQTMSECVKYYDKDSLEKVLSESNGKEAYSPEFMNSILPIGVSNCNTPDDKENIMDIFSPLQSNSNYEDIELNHEQENLLPESMFIHSQDDTVHSCATLDDVFAEHEPIEENTNITSSSPEVSSTTSEEKNSSILLKITNYKGSRISQINGITTINNRPSCKFTEENEYSHSHSNFSKNRPLLTKAAQKYIPPLRESIRDLKVKLTLPQQSLIKLKQLKTSKDVPKPIKQTNNNMLRTPKKPKPKFEDVLMSIDEIQFQKHKEKSRKAKKIIPKVVIKKTQNGSHYASTSSQDEFNPDLTGRKWQPWVFLEKNLFIDKMAIRHKTKAVFSHRKKTYVMAEKFKKYKAVNSGKFVISQPKTDNSSTGLKYTIRLKHSY